MIGHWLHFSYGDQMEMEVSVWEMFLAETVAMAK